MCGDVQPNPGLTIQQYAHLQVATIGRMSLRLLPTLAGGHYFVYTILISMATYLNMDTNYDEI